MTDGHRGCGIGLNSLPAHPLVFRVAKPRVPQSRSNVSWPRIRARGRAAASSSASIFRDGRESDVSGEALEGLAGSTDA